MLLVPHLTGCYRYVPVGGAAVPAGAEVSLGLTDPGRVALAPVLGPGVSRLTGRGVASTDSSLVIAVTSVEYFNASGIWTLPGQRVELGREFVAELREKRLSRSRTWLAVGLAVAGLVATSLIAIAGFGSDGGTGQPGNGNGQPQ